MINHFVATGQDELREELSLLVQLYRSFLNFSPRHGRGIMGGTKRHSSSIEPFAISLVLWPEKRNLLLVSRLRNMTSTFTSLSAKYRLAPDFWCTPLNTCFSSCTQGTRTQALEYHCCRTPLPSVFARQVGSYRSRNLCQNERAE